MPRLLVIHHSPTQSMQSLTEAVLAGACDPQIKGVEVVVRLALEATAADVLAADGYVLGSTANFGYMSGAMKHFFDTTFLQVGGSLDEHGGASESAGVTAKRPFGLYVHGRYDTTGAVRSILSITGALGWRQSAATHEVGGWQRSAASRQVVHSCSPLLGLAGGCGGGFGRGEQPWVMSRTFGGAPGRQGCGCRGPGTRGARPPITSTTARSDRSTPRHRLAFSVWLWSLFGRTSRPYIGAPRVRVWAPAVARGLIGRPGKGLATR